MAEDSIAASAKGATFMVLLQVGSRAITFALNQILLRFLSPKILGMAVYLELYIHSSLYFSRESLRIATQRRSDGVQAAINISYLAIAAGLPIGALMTELLLRSNYPDVPYLTTSLRISQLTAMIELLSEPAFVAVQQNMLYKTRAAAEATAVIVKTFVTAGLVFWAQGQGQELGVLPFAAGELAYSSALTIVYLTQTAPVARLKGFSLLPKWMQTSTRQYAFSLFSKPLLYLSASLYLQTAIKWALTEGDKLLVGFFATLEDQGIYAVSANYGGLIARMLFRPIEDSSRNLFAKLCSDTKPKSDSKDEKAASKDDNGSIKQASTILRDILRIYSIASLITFAVGPTAAPLLLQVVAGNKWTDSGAGEVLATYCYCIPLLAINGVSEAFVSATASPAELQRQSFWMGAFTVGFGFSAFVFLRVLEMGAQGLVLANCLNMALRIVFNLSFATRFFERQGVEFKLRDILPNLYAVGATAVVPSLLARTQGLLGQYGILGDLVRVGAIGAVFAAFM
ncbi:Oligosaccharide translocation protein rft1 [Recurvomyces mirabilis]|nr:Oligosaccharide translocation protein rft1 [Recurvomyces mirabilis]